MQAFKDFLHLVKPLPNNKILDWSKLKTFAGNKKDAVKKMMGSIHNRVENTVGKGENPGNQPFLLFAHCFPKSSSIGLGWLKVMILW